MEPKVLLCRAAVLWEEGKPLKIEEISVDPPNFGEVRVRMVSAGICASDAHLIWGWDTDVEIPLNGNPIVLGHEGAGIVESVGEGVQSVKSGDKVIPLWMPNCGSCSLCLNPMTNFCETGNVITNSYQAEGEVRRKVDGKPLMALAGTGTFSEYIVLRENQVLKVDDNLDIKNACIIGCAVGTGYGNASNLAKVHFGSKCAIWGLGAIGLSTALACKELGATRIIGIDTNSEKESFGMNFGCTEFINPKHIDKPIDEFLQESGGIEYAFDCIGNKEVLLSGFKSLTPWGTLVVVGLGPRGNTIEVPVADLLTGKTITGGYFGKQKPNKVIPELVKKYMSGKLPIDSLITHRFKLEQINEAFGLLYAGKTIRAVIDF